MPLSLSAVLAHPSVVPAAPLVLAGGNQLHRPVRWVHSSEVLDIAPLLHGGELLLTGGEVLAGSSPAERRRYVKELAARRVTAVAIETGSRLPSIPTDMLAQANRDEFPVIELRRVVPFVDVAEAINGALVDSSVTLLKYGAELTHHLTAVVADGGGVQQILDELASRTATPVTLFDAAGSVIASSPSAEVGDRGEPAKATITSPVSIRGVHTAILALYPDPGADLELLDLAADRGGESLGLALLRSRPPTSRDLARSELVRLAGSEAPSIDRVKHLGQLVGLRAAAPVVGIVGTSSGGSTGMPQLDHLLRRHGRTVVDRPAGSELHAIVSFEDHQGVGELRAELLADLRRWALAHEETAVVVGPAFPDLGGAPASLGAALETARRLRTVNPGVVDARQHTLDRLLSGEGHRSRLERIVTEQLSPFMAVRARERDLLLASLEAYFEAGCNKSTAASRLRVERQTLHARLRRAFKILGGDPTGSASALPLHLALRLRTMHARDNPGEDPLGKHP